MLSSLGDASHHAHSIETPDSIHEDDLRFWEHRGPCECLESHLETVMLHGSLVEGHGAGFIRYVVREGKALKTIAIVCSDEKASGFRESAVGGSGEIVLCVATLHWSFQAAALIYHWMIRLAW